MEISAPKEKYRLFLYHLAEQLFENTDEIMISASENEDSVKTEINNKSKISSAVSYFDTSLHLEKERAKKVSFGKAFFEAAKAFDIRPVPYGTLTGVRPAKVPLFYLEKGHDKESVLSILQKEYYIDPDKASLLIKIAEKERTYSFSKSDAMLYISIPFCPSRCSYCSFVSVKTEKEGDLINAYLPLLFEEIIGISQIFKEKSLRLRAVYIGGGTPGILSAAQIEKLLSVIKNNFDFSFAPEFTFELGRPDTISIEKLSVLHDHGIKRISINPQTTSDTVLSAIGRKHTAADYYDAMEKALGFGSFSINCDLIAGLDADTPSGFIKSVNDVIALGAQSITLHALCKKNAASKKEFIFGKEFSEAMAISHSNCIKSSYQPYYLYRQKNAVANLENTGFALPSHECIYNIAMMEDMANILSCGAGSATKILTNDKIKRFYSYKYPFEYLRDREKIRQNLSEIKKLL